MTESQTQSSAALTEAARELQSAGHDAQVAFDCIALGELDRAHTHALTARVALDAAVTALAATLDDAGHEEDAGHEDNAGHEENAGDEENAGF